MIRELDTQAWVDVLLALERPNLQNILVYYEHRIGAFCRNPQLMLVPLDDHLVHRGDGAFEGLRMSQRRILQLDAHLRRLKESVMVLKLEPPCSWDEMRDIMLEVAKAADVDEGGLKLLLGRGGGGLGVDPAECPKASLYIVASRAKVLPASYWEKGLTACRSTVPPKQPYLARIKSTNYLPNAMMAQEARQRGVDLTFSFDPTGNLAEAAIANVGIVDQQGRLLFPHFEYALPGTTALLAMEVAKAFIPVELAEMPEDTLLLAKEILVFGTTPECVGVVRYEGHEIGDGKPGPIALELRQRLHAALIAGGTVY